MKELSNFIKIIIKGFSLGIVIVILFVTIVPLITQSYGEYKLSEDLSAKFPFVTENDAEKLFVVHYLDSDMDIRKMDNKCYQAPIGTTIKLITKEPLLFQIDAPYKNSECPSQFFASHQTVELTNHILTISSVL